MARPRDVLVRAEREAAADLARYRREPAGLGQLRLGRFSDAGIRSLLLRRLLLIVPIPLVPLVAVSSLSSGRVQAKAKEFLGEVAYWRRVKTDLARAEWEALTHGPVVLMYHAIGASGEPASRYILPEACFRRHVAWLKRRNYRLLQLCELAESRTAGKLPPARSVVITLDDGYHDNALALARIPIPATVFVVTRKLGGTNDWDTEGNLAGRPLMGWEDARKLVQASVEIGAHTCTHPALPEVQGTRVNEEIDGSRQDLERELGMGPHTFAYPHGRFDARTQEAVERAGFAGACCSRGGVNDPAVPQFELRRVEVKGTDSFMSFVLMVWLGRRITPGQLLGSLILG